jgi:hypothetical protein
LRRKWKIENRGNFAGAKFGGRGPIVDELLNWVEEYPIQWREPSFNLAELAKLRWIKRLSTPELAKHYGKTHYSIQNYYTRIRRKGFKIDGLTQDDLEKIKKAAKNWNQV